MGRKGDGIEIRDGSIRIGFTLEGKRHKHTLMINGAPMAPTPANVKYAKRLGVEIREKIRAGAFSLAEYFPASGGVTPSSVSTQLDDWLATQRIEESTKAGYKSAINFWKASIGDTPLRMLKISSILKALAERPDLSGKTINNYTSVLREALALAVKDHTLTTNPAEAVPPAKWQKEPPDPFTAEERDKIIADAAARYPGQVANFIEFWMWTGLRTSEIFGLRWENVDLASGSILIAEAVVRGIKKDRTKTNVARTVKLNSRALAALQRQRAHTHMAGQEVFQDPRYTTAWIDERAFRRSYWTPILKLLGIRYRRPYNCRHTYATALLMAGANHAWCAKQLGHSVEMFQRTYAKWIDGEQNDREMDKLESVLSPESPQHSVVRG